MKIRKRWYTFVDRSDHRRWGFDVMEMDDGKLTWNLCWGRARYTFCWVGK